MLSIGLEDTLAYYNADDFVVGFKKMLAWQVRVIKQNEARQVAWLSIGMEDRLASCAIAAFAAGFLKSVAFQMRVINQVEHRLVRRGHLDHETESWQLTHFPRCDGVHGPEGHAVQSVLFEHGCGGHSRILLGRGFCGWLPGASHQAEQWLVRRWHLDHETGSWQHCKSFGEGSCTDDEVLDLMTLNSGILT